MQIKKTKQHQQHTKNFDLNDVLPEHSAYLPQHTLTRAPTHTLFEHFHSYQGCLLLYTMQRHTGSHVHSDISLKDFFGKR